MSTVFYIILNHLCLLLLLCFFRFNYRSTHHLTTNGFYEFLNWFDERAWYPLGRIVGGTVSVSWKRIKHAVKAACFFFILLHPKLHLITPITLFCPEFVRLVKMGSNVPVLCENRQGIAKFCIFFFLWITGCFYCLRVS